MMVGWLIKSVLVTSDFIIPSLCFMIQLVHFNVSVREQALGSLTLTVEANHFYDDNIMDSVILLIHMIRMLHVYVLAAVCAKLLQLRDIVSAVVRGDVSCISLERCQKLVLNF